MRDRIAEKVDQSTNATSVPALRQQQPSAAASHYGGVQNREESAVSVEPYRIDVASGVMASLRKRLDDARFSDEVAEGWGYGTDGATLREFIARWRDHDWTARQDALNMLPQYRATIDGFGIHFLHFRGKGPAPRALLLANGWPSSFVEYLPIVAALADPAAHGGDPRDGFDVVIPAMPGYGFSDRPTHPHQVRALDLYHKLMTKCLGYTRFALAGSDIGLGIATRMALEYPDSVTAIHLCGVATPPLAKRGAPFTEAEQRFLEQQTHWDNEEGAYQRLQQTRPQTIAFALSDSPVGLASWIVEKFHFWSDLSGKSVLDALGDALLDNLTIYWATNTIGSSMRLYYESRRWPRPFAATDRVRVPTSILVLPKDLEQPPREWAERFYDVARYTVAKRGGHFPSLEVPQAYLADLRAAFANV